MQRSQQFLLLSALLTLLLSVAAVAVAMGHYCRSRYDLVAVLKTLGADKRALRRLIVGQWVSVLALAGACGSLVGLALLSGGGMLLWALLGGTAVLALWLLQCKVFDFPWEPNVVMWGALPLSAALLLSLCGGWLGLRLLSGKALFRQFAG